MQEKEQGTSLINIDFHNYHHVIIRFQCHLGHS
jgi:hypothetical protein